MTGSEIFSKIEFNKEKIRAISGNCTFVLNREIAALKKENKELQEQCPHEFIEGKCRWCGKKQ